MERKGETEVEIDADSKYNIFDVSDFVDDPGDFVAPEEETDDAYVAPDDVGSGPSGSAVYKYAGGDQLPHLPSRESFVKLSPLHNKIEAAIMGGQPVLFTPVDVDESNDYINGVPTYRLHLFGALADGSKAHVVLEDIEVFFYARVPPGRDPGEFETELRMYLDEKAEDGSGPFPPSSIADEEKFPGFGFHEAPVAYKKIVFDDTRQRKGAIKVLRKKGVETGADALTAHYRKVSTDYELPLQEWMILSDYTREAGRSKKDPLCAHVFRLPIGKARPLVNPADPLDKQAKSAAIKRGDPNLNRENIMVMPWDVESKTTRKTGDTLPRAHNPEDGIFMISMLPFWKDSTEPLAGIIIVDKPINPDKRWITYVCGSEENCLKAFALVWRAFAPDIEIGFNTHDYDWPFVAERAKQYGLLTWFAERMSAAPRYRTTEEGVYQWNYVKGQPVKISADQPPAMCNYLKFPGCVSLDVRVCFMKIFPKSEAGKKSSLNFYLKECKLPSKDDMPIKRMFRFYERGDKEGLRQVAHYCLVDSVRCQQLMVKKGVINDLRSLANRSMTSLVDAHYRAGGMKVCNFNSLYTKRNNTVCSMISREVIETGKYPGAWVFPPKKGLERRRPTTGLDAQSLYPSIIRAFNYSPDRYVATAARAKELREKGYVLHENSFMFNGREIKSWWVQHNNDPAQYGFYVKILDDLFNQRAAVKAILAPLKALIEFLDLVTGDAKKESKSVAAVLRAYASAAVKLAREESKEPKEPKAPKDAKTAGKEAKERAKKVKEAKARVEIIAGLAAKSPKYRETGVLAMTDAQLEAAVKTEHERASFDFAGVNALQNAIKVLMNTFYGEAGNSISPFFLLALAGAVTSTGQQILKMVAKLAEDSGFSLKYGDTDSVYIVAPERHFEQCDADFDAGRTTREEYWTQMVEITMVAVDEFRDEINAFLVKFTRGGKFLKFAYEDVLFPVVFTGKKKYFGIAHIELVNFHPKKLFIRGIDVVKQGQTALAKEIGFKIMWAAMALDQDGTLFDIVDRVLTDAIVNHKQWKFEHFVLTAAFKPDKDNKTVKRFVARTEAKHAIEKRENELRVARGETPRPPLYIPPEAGERFEYVLVKRGVEFDLRGRKAALKTGDLMEYASVARALGLEIDVSYYLKSYIVGLCARFINYDERFQPKAPGRKYSEKELDAESQKAAKKYLEGVVKRLGGEDVQVSKNRRLAYTAAYREAAAIAFGELDARVGGSAEILGGLVGYDVFLDDEDEDRDATSKVVAAVCEAAQQRAAETVAEYSAGYNASLARRLGISADGSDLKNPSESSELFSRTRARKTGAKTPVPRWDKREAALRTKIAGLVPDVATSATKFEVDLSRLVGELRPIHEERRQSGVKRKPGVAAAATAPVVLSLEQSDCKAVEEMGNLFWKLVGIYVARDLQREFGIYLSSLKSKRMGAVAAPARGTTRESIAAAAKRIPIRPELAYDGLG